MTEQSLAAIAWQWSSYIDINGGQSIVVWFVKVSGKGPLGEVAGKDESKHEEGRGSNLHTLHGLEIKLML